MPKQSRNSTKHSGVFFVELDSGDQTFFIRYKKDEGFGEGNFKALFESIERDQLERGVIENEGN